MHLTAELNQHAIEVMPLTISITMSVKEWYDIMRGEHYATGTLQGNISRVLGQIAQMSKQTLVAPSGE